MIHFDHIVLQKVVLSASKSKQARGLARSMSMATSAIAD